MILNLICIYIYKTIKFSEFVFEICMCNFSSSLSRLLQGLEWITSHIRRRWCCSLERIHFFLKSWNARTVLEECVMYDWLGKKISAAQNMHRVVFGITVFKNRILDLYLRNLRVKSVCCWIPYFDSITWVGWWP